MSIASEDKIGLTVALVCAAAQTGVGARLAAYRGHCRCERLAAAALGQLLSTSAALAYVARELLGRGASASFASGHSFLNWSCAAWAVADATQLAWSILLALCSSILALGAGATPDSLRLRALAVLGAVNFGFILLPLTGVNTYLPVGQSMYAVAESNGLVTDPLRALQSLTLYAGDAVLAVPFAFAAAALLAERLEANWAQYARVWAVRGWVLAWVGLLLECWRAREEGVPGALWVPGSLDGVVVAQWCVAAALVYSLTLAARRRACNGWALLLAMFAFALIVLGAFLVHSAGPHFPESHGPGWTSGVIGFDVLRVLSGGALLLYGWRIALADIQTDETPALTLREWSVLLRSYVLAIACAMMTIAAAVSAAESALGWPKL